MICNLQNSLAFSKLPQNKWKSGFVGDNFQSAFNTAPSAGCAESIFITMIAYSTIN